MMWINGHFVSEEEAKIHPQDRGLLLGEGIFETLRIANQKPLDWELHLNRLWASAQFFNFQTPFTKEELYENVLLLIKNNSDKNAALRITVTAGSGGRGLIANANTASSWMMQLSVLPRLCYYKNLVLVDICRNEKSVSAHHKTINYLDNIMARKQSIALGGDEALMLNTQSKLACVAAGNIFIQQGQNWITPPITDGALPGIVRSRLLKSNPWLEIKEQSVSTQMLGSATAMFVSNSLIGLIPVHAYEHQSLQIPDYYRQIRNWVLYQE